MILLLPLRERGDRPTRVGYREIEWIISVWWLVMCDASDIKGFDRMALELSITPLHMKRNANSIEINYIS